MSERQYVERIEELEKALHDLRVVYHAMRIENHTLQLDCRAKTEALISMNKTLAEVERANAWVDRRDALPDQSRQCMFFTNHLDGFIWIGRRGLLPNDVSHWRYLPEPPLTSKPDPASLEEPECSS